MTATSQPRASRFSRSFWLLLIACTSVAAMTGLSLLIVELFTHWPRQRVVLSGWEGPIRFTILLVAAGAAVAMGNALALDRYRGRTAAIAGLGFAITGVLLGVHEAWAWWRWGWEVGTEKLMAIWVWGIACSVIAMIRIAQVPRGFFWVRQVTDFMLILSAVFVTDYCWNPWSNRGPVFPLTFADITMIIALWGILAIVVLHKINRIKHADEVTGSLLAMKAHCPRCERPQQLGMGVNFCGGCGLRMRVEIDEAHCESCGYPLLRLQGDRCPECGTVFRRAPSAVLNADPPQSSRPLATDGGG